MVEEKKREFGEGIEFDDVENFSTEDQQFSHQVLIMKCLNKCIETGNVEMVEGRKETKVDKQGNISVKFLPDTRKQFIESVKTAKNFIKCDFDDKATENIENIMRRIKKNKEKWLKKEFDWWENLNWETQQKLIKNKMGVVEGMHNQEHSFYNDSLLEELDFWREILEEINELTKRLDFYERVAYIG